MSKEFVVDYTDPQSGQPCKLDINNGYLYDLSGNQIARWYPGESTTSEHETQQACVDWVNDRHEMSMRIAQGLPIAAMRELSNTIQKRPHSDVVTMDLGNQDVHIPSALPNFAGGYRLPTPVADIASPPLLVDHQSDKYWVFSQNDAYQVAAPIVGSGGSQAAEIPPRLANQSYIATEYALGYFVPTQLEANQDAALNIRKAALKRVLNNLMQRREQRVANLLSTSGNWNSNNVVTLGSGFQWDGGASSDPVHDIHTRMEQSLGDVTGIIMSEPLWHAFQRNPAVQKYFTYKDGTAAIPDPSEMQSILNLPPIYPARLKSFAPVGGALTFTWGNAAILIRQPEQMPPVTQDDIATSYTFRWNAGKSHRVPDQTQGMGWAAAGGFVVREFFNQVRGTMGGSQLVCLHWDQEAMTSQYVGGAIFAAFQ